MPEFTKGEAAVLLRAARSFSARFESSIAGVLAKELRGVQPTEVVQMLEQLTLLVRQLELKPKTLKVHDAHAGLLKRIVIDERRAVAEELEAPLAKAIQPEVVKALARELRPLEELMGADWFRDAKTLRVPRLTDFMSIRFAERATEGLAPLAPRVFDEKFHILEAPSLFFGDLAHYRARCANRAAPVAVAYLDIDDFKALNSRYSETLVDLRVLAPFMELVEAAVFAHGHAYRFGGDEYVLIVPNLERRFVIELVRAIQKRIADQRYAGVDARTTVSAGVCHIDENCPLTDREALGRANLAKNAAKQKRKGSLALVEGPTYGLDAVTFPDEPRSSRPPRGTAARSEPSS